MAGTSPHGLTNIGQGGLQGVAAMQEFRKEEQVKQQAAAAQALSKERVGIEAQKLQQQLNQFNNPSAFQKAQIGRWKVEDAEKLRTPIKIGERPNGSPLMAMPRLIPDTGAVDLHLIRADGTIEPTSMQSAPVAAQPQQPGAPSQGRAGAGRSGYDFRQPTGSRPGSPACRSSVRRRPSESAQARDESYLGEDRPARPSAMPQTLKHNRRL